MGVETLAGRGACMEIKPKGGYPDENETHKPKGAAVKTKDKIELKEKRGKGLKKKLEECKGTRNGGRP